MQLTVDQIETLDTEIWAVTQDKAVTKDLVLSLVEAIEASDDFDPDTFNDDGTLNELADSAVSIYNHEIAETWARLRGVCDSLTLDELGEESVAITVRERGIYGLMASDLYLLYSNALHAAVQALDTVEVA